MQKNRQIYRWTNRQTKKLQTDKCAYRQIGRQKD